MASRQGFRRRAGAVCVLAVGIAGLAVEPSAARTGVNCDDAANTITANLTDMQAKTSVGYHDAIGAGDQLGIRAKGTGESAGTGFFGSCGNTDTNWTYLTLNLGGLSDSARLDGKHPSVAADIPGVTEPVPSWVQVDILSGDGNDTLTGHKGDDGFFAGKGKDTIDVVGPGDDLADCGGGHKDVAFINRGDDLAQNCEKVIRR